MASIDKREWKGSVSYRARVRVNGQTRAATFTRKTDAKLWAGKVEAELKSARYVPTRDDMRRTVADLVDRYLAEVLPIKAHNKDQRMMRQRLGWWRKAIGTFPLVDCTPGLIGECRDKLHNTTNRFGERLSAGTVNRYLAALSAAFKQAAGEWEWLERNPVRGVARRSESPGRVRFLSDDERQRLLTECRKSRSDQLYPVVVLALATGARKGEILKVTWDDVNLDRGVMALRDTKNRDDRVLPLTAHLVDLLTERSRVRRIDSRYVFPGTRRGTHASIDTAWQEARERAKVENFRFHDLRHSCASYLAMNGATLAEIAEILGHKTLQMVKRYSHLSESHVAGVLERMSEKIF